jgi:hypothetical protein
MRANDFLLAVVLGVAVAHNTYECTTALAGRGHASVAEQIRALLNPNPLRPEPGRWSADDSAPSHERHLGSHHSQEQDVGVQR